MPSDIYTTDFSKYLPQALQRDPKIAALAKAVTDQLLSVSNVTDKVLIYNNIDELPEELLDILAYDFHCDWYDYSYPIETKRKLLKSNVVIHKHLGTKFAVEKALSDVYSTAKVQEWFEYEGNPYCFKVVVNVSNEGITAGTTAEIEKKMWFYKNLRSHCDGIFYILSGNTTATAYTLPFAEIGGGLKVKAFLEDKISQRAQTVTHAVAKNINNIKVKAFVADKVISGGSIAAISY